MRSNEVKIDRGLQPSLIARVENVGHSRRQGLTTSMSFEETSLQRAECANQALVRNTIQTGV